MVGTERQKDNEFVNIERHPIVASVFEEASLGRGLGEKHIC